MLRCVPEVTKLIASFWREPILTRSESEAAVHQISLHVDQSAMQFITAMFSVDGATTRQIH